MALINNRIWFSQILSNFFSRWNDLKDKKISNSFDQCNHEISCTRKMTKGHKLFSCSKWQKLFCKPGKGFQAEFSFAMDNSTCYKFCDKKLSPQYNFKTKCTHLNFENSPTSQVELKYLLIPGNSKLSLNVINRSNILIYV